MLSRLEISQSDFDELTAFIKEKYGLDLARKKYYRWKQAEQLCIGLRLQQLFRISQRRLQRWNRQRNCNLINRLTTNHTYFMRETDHFQHFMEKFLPYAEKKTSSIMICVYGVQAVHSATSHISCHVYGRLFRLWPPFLGLENTCHGYLP